jgi:hypothetical protein
MDSTPQGLWLGHVLERKLGILDKHPITASPAIWHDMPGEYFECTRKLTANQSNQDKQQHGICRLNNIDEHDTTGFNMNVSMACTYYSWYEHDDTSTSMREGGSMFKVPWTNLLCLEVISQPPYISILLTTMIITRSPQDQPSMVSTIPS